MNLITILLINWSFILF